MIGDAGFAAADRFPHVVDLGAAWRALTGLPFVYAVWAGRPGAVDDEDIALLRASLTPGLAARAEIARAWAEAHGGDPALYERYLTDNIRYRLGAEELSGMAAFFDARPRRRAGARSRRKPDAGPRPLATGRPSDRGQRLAGSARRQHEVHRRAAGRRGRAAAGSRPRTRFASTPRRRCWSWAPPPTQRRRALHPDGVVTYIIDRNVNYTNVCVTRCKFCNFYRPPTNKTDGYVLSREQLAQKFQETVDLGGVQILLQGGLNPEPADRLVRGSLPLDEGQLPAGDPWPLARGDPLHRRDREHADPQVIERLVAAGLDSIPGGGAEILDDEIRHAISPLKCTTDTWLEVMREAHALGLRTTATMVFGFGETPRHIVNHLERLRALQDQTAGFTAFICWPFQAEGTRLKLRDDTTAMRYLRVFALARLYLDNFPSLQVSWPTMGPEVGQVGAALRRQRLRLGDDRGERRVAGGRGLQARRRGHRALHRGGRLRPAPPQHALRAARRRREPACGSSARAG